MVHKSKYQINQRHQEERYVDNLYRNCIHIL